MVEGDRERHLLAKLSRRRCSVSLISNYQKRKFTRLPNCCRTQRVQSMKHIDICPGGAGKKWHKAHRDNEMDLPVQQLSKWYQPKDFSQNTLTRRKNIAWLCSVYLPSIHVKFVLLSFCKWGNWSLGRLYAKEVLK